MFSALFAAALIGAQAASDPEWPRAYACYGQVANLVETDFEKAEAWRATIYWSTEMHDLVAKHLGRPSDVHNAQREARLAAHAGTLVAPVGYDIARCIADSATKAGK